VSFGDPYTFLIRLVYLIPAVLVGFVLHEMAHAYVAVARGDDTPRRQGRLSPDPRRHLEPIGLVMVALVGVGFARPVTINPSALRGRAARVTVALAGPITNLLIAVVASLLLKVFVGGDYVVTALTPLPCTLTGSPHDLFATELFYMYRLNLYLFIFNLLPIPSLDGFELIRAYLRTRNPRLLFQIEMNRQAILLVVILIFLFLPGVLFGLMNLVIIPISRLLGVPPLGPCG